MNSHGSDNLSDVDIAQELERLFSVDQWKAGPLCIWPYIRIQITTQLLSNKNRSRVTGNSRHPRERLCRFIKDYRKRIGYLAGNGQWSRLALSSILEILKLNSNGKVYTAIFDHEVDREITKRGSYSRFSDSIIDSQIDQSSAYVNFSLITSRPPSKPYRRTIYINLLLHLARVLSRILGPLILESWVQAEINSAANWCNRKGTSIDLNPSSAAVTARYIQCLSKLYEILLLFCNIKKVIVACWYSPDAMALCHACHNLSIPCIDIQHGVAGAGKHRAYFNWTKIPSNGYSLMPSHYWCWTSDDARAIQAWLGDKAKKLNSTRVVGIPFAEALKNNDDVKSFFSNSAALGNLIKLKKRYKATVIFTMQGPSIPLIVQQSIKSSESDIFWFLRAHPAHRIHDKQSQKLLNTANNVDADINASIPLLVALQHVSVHVTEFSSSFYEASAMNIRTVFIDPMALRFFAHPIQSGQALYCSDSELLVKMIRLIMAS